MKFAHIYHAIHFEPWLIEPSAHAAIVALLESRMGEAALMGASPGVEAVGFKLAPGKNLWGEDLPTMKVTDGIAHIPIMGTLGNGLGGLEKSCGACGLEDVQQNVQDAVARPDVKGMLFGINSPGGTLGGLPETAAMIRQAGTVKPTVAHTGGNAASAAYWLASQAQMIVGTPSSMTGSIGVYMPWADKSRAAEMQGVKIDVIKNTGGTHKGMGIPGTSLTDAQRGYLQERCDELFGMFKGEVLSQRANVASDCFTGKTYLGATAKKKGLIDDVGDYSHAVATLRALIGRH
jgi:signal peptide peptidase SppA